jgi:hypothetical protein
MEDMENAEGKFLDASDLLLTAEGAMHDFNEKNDGDIIGIYTTVRVAKDTVLDGIEQMQHGTGKVKQLERLVETQAMQIEAQAKQIETLTMQIKALRKQKACAPKPARRGKARRKSARKPTKIV